MRGAVCSGTIRQGCLNFVWGERSCGGWGSAIFFALARVTTVGSLPACSRDCLGWEGTRRKTNVVHFGREVNGTKCAGRSSHLLVEIAFMSMQPHRKIVAFHQDGQGD